MAQWLKGTVTANTHWTDTLFSIKVQTEPFDFIAGQFVRLALDTADGKAQRAYSLLNSPGSKEQEFLVSTVADGLLSPLLQQLKPGDTVQVSQPASGFFILDEVPDGENLWLISTGTGIGPYLSMLGTETPWQRFSSIILLHSVRFEAELVYQPLIRQFQDKYGKQLHYQPVVTREKSVGALQQRIPDLIQSGLLQTACGQSLDLQSQVLLCGNPQMITETKAVLESLGLKKNLRRDPGQITVEQYWK
ncbi:ferredoxin--NADP reductase [Rheinheimera soli]|uniref:ferredoxin--NADP(+) reductase n=1 Tax=Rheinheimera soli TaxID=443616 RepID=A0ABU1VY92_9GAMM|nr:ferredoxin--NADP reductase [Rheinheimera soli]MDR7120423.1 ferredoxin--NADP+ reductase [Rheinheimera soli]